MSKLRADVIDLVTLPTRTANAVLELPCEAERARFAMTSLATPGSAKLDASSGRDTALFSR